jgi:hypothetical protein
MAIFERAGLSRRIGADRGTALVLKDAEHPGLHSHAERGNDHLHTHWLIPNDGNQL